jgi:hypothetical protein
VKTKILVAAALLAVSGLAAAQHPEYRGGGYYHNGYYGGYSWGRSYCDPRCTAAIVGGTVLGAVIVNEIERNRQPNVIYVPVPAAPPPVVLQPPPPEVIYVPSYRPRVIIIRE